jgi:hypothetical protein
MSRTGAEDRKVSSFRALFEKAQRVFRDGRRRQMTRMDYYKVAPGGVKAVYALEQYLRASELGPRSSNS